MIFVNYTGEDRKIRIEDEIALNPIENRRIALKGIFERFSSGEGTNVDARGILLRLMREHPTVKTVYVILPNVNDHFRSLVKKEFTMSPYQPLILTGEVDGLGNHKHKRL